VPAAGGSGSANRGEFLKLSLRRLRDHIQCLLNMPARECRLLQAISSVCLFFDAFRESDQTNTSTLTVTAVQSAGKLSANLAPTNEPRLPAGFWTSDVQAAIQSVRKMLREKNGL
jgi:hypothetical protein